MADAGDRGVRFRVGLPFQVPPGRACASPVPFVPDTIIEFSLAG